jgi:uncharacterized protein YbjT (DUF2867 family)
MERMTILVTGGTGTLGRHVVAGLRDAGEPVRLLSRRPGPDTVVGDLRTGAGLAEAVRGVATVVHCATGRRYRKIDVAGTRRLLAAARSADVGHMVYVSIVGVDRVPFGYYRAKLEAERLVEASGIPWTILRATQFHELLYGGLRSYTKSPLLLLPKGFRFQPIAAADVAQRLAALARAAPAGRVADLGGPQIHPVADLLHAYLGAVRKRRAVVSVPVPGKAAAGFRAGGNLTPEHRDGRVTWDDYVRSRLTRRPTGGTLDVSGRRDRWPSSLSSLRSRARRSGR